MPAHARRQLGLVSGVVPGAPCGWGLARGFAPGPGDQTMFNTITPGPTGGAGNTRTRAASVHVIWRSKGRCNRVGRDIGASAPHRGGPGRRDPSVDAPPSAGSDAALRREGVPGLPRRMPLKKSGGGGRDGASEMHNGSVYGPYLRVYRRHQYDHYLTAEHYPLITSSPARPALCLAGGARTTWYRAANT